MSLTLSQARSIVNEALVRARSMKLAPLTVAVLDPGGHLVALDREDGASTLRPQIAIGKAATALALGVSSRKVGEMAAQRPAFIASLGPIAPHGIVPVAGGVIVVDATGTVLGAVGATGDTSDNDEACVLAGIAAAGFAKRD